jgi:hypothetical protein
MRKIRSWPRVDAPVVRETRRPSAIGSRREQRSSGDGVRAITAVGARGEKSANKSAGRLHRRRRSLRRVVRVNASGSRWNASLVRLFAIDRRMRKIAAEQPVSAVSLLAADAAFKLSVSERPTNLRRMSPSMRRSVPTLASGRHMSSSPGHPFDRQARSFNASSSFKDSRATSANSSHSASSVDTRHIRLTMEKRDSKSSILSGGSTMGENSRPLSAESIDNSSPRPRVGSSHSASHLTNGQFVSNFPLPHSPSIPFFFSFSFKEFVGQTTLRTLYYCFHLITFGDILAKARK